MERIQIDRCNGRRGTALMALCVVQATGIAWVPPTSAAQNEPEEVVVTGSRIHRRIDVLQDGVSPICGSDAIAGVVNIITRSHYRGFDLETNQAAFDEGDGYTQDPVPGRYFHARAALKL